MGSSARARGIPVGPGLGSPDVCLAYRSGAWCGVQGVGRGDGVASGGFAGVDDLWESLGIIDCVALVCWGWIDPSTIAHVSLNWLVSGVQSCWCLCWCFCWWS